MSLNTAQSGESANSDQIMNQMSAQEVLEDNDSNTFSRNTDKSMIVILSIISFVGVGVILLYFYSFPNFFPSANDAHDWEGLRGQFGTFGDFFGGILNPFLSFCTIYLLITSIKLQLRELRATRQELKRTRISHQQQVTTLQSQTVESQRYYTEQIATLEKQRNQTLDLHKQQMEQSVEAHKLQLQIFEAQRKNYSQLERQFRSKHDLDLIDKNRSDIENLMLVGPLVGLNSSSLIVNTNQEFDSEIFSAAKKVEEAICQHLALLTNFIHSALTELTFYHYLEKELSFIQSAIEKGFFKGEARDVSILNNLKILRRATLTNNPKPKWSYAFNCRIDEIIEILETYNGNNEYEKENSMLDAWYGRE